jgi:urease accessory protein
MRLFTGRFARFLPLTVATAAVALPAAAHTGVDGMAGGLMAGLAHPVFGLDHLLVMVAVGLWGAQLGSRLWLLPACFMAALSVGMGLAVLGVGLPAV